MSAEANGRVKLSWAQIVWAVAMLSAIIGAWADLRNQNALTRQEMGLRFQQSDVEHGRLWKAIDEANAAEVSRNSRRAR